MKSAMIWAALLISLTVSAFPHGVFAQQTFDDWAISCAEPGGCRLAQTIMSSERVWIATVLMHPRAPDQPLRQAEVFVPPGLHFPSGLYASLIGGELTPLRAEWRQCSARACAGVITLDPAQESAWQRGRAVELRFRPGPGAPVAVAELSLMGVTAGLRALDALGAQE
ncbi:MAG: invasion associated locus B family protein [Paracoccaceae bacterium]